MRKNILDNIFHLFFTTNRTGLGTGLGSSLAYHIVQNIRREVEGKEKKNQQAEGYEPTVLVSTKRVKDKVEIGVKDNGSGIPDKILDRIFQPFFTTKPTGQGTGLGLSLSYDIIKAHGGELKVITKQGEGTEFVVDLPLNGST